MLKSLGRELRFLTQSPGFTLAAVMTLALGIAGTTIVFSLLYAVVLRPLPYGDSQRLVWVWSTRNNGQQQRVSYPDFMDWMAQSRTLESWAGWGTYEAVLTGVVEPQRLQAALIMGNLFTLLGVPPQIGALAAVDNVNPQEPTVVLSHDFWEQHLNSDPAVLGRHLTLNGLNYTVVGVMPSGFRFPIHPTKRIDLWIPLIRFNPVLEKKRDARLVEVLARLRSKVTLDQAQAEMDVIASRLRRQYPDTNQDAGIHVVSAFNEVTAGASYSVWILFASVGALLLIACANIANLQMARAVARERDISIRRALGASRTRIAAQVLWESLILAVLGGVVGFIGAIWSVRAVRAFIPSTLPRGDEISVNGHVLAFALFAVVMAGLLFSLAPLCHASRVQLSIMLQETQHSIAGNRKQKRLAGLLAVGEIALAVILLVGAGLLMQTFWRLQQPERGFDPQSVLTFEISWPSEKYRNPVPAFQELQRRLLAINGVIAASVGLQMPERGGPNLDAVEPFFEIEGRPLAPAERSHALIMATQPGYFRALGIPLVKGRDFEEKEMRPQSRVAIINESLARTYFRNEDPIGKRVKLNSWTLFEERTEEIVGVARDVKHGGLDRIQPLIYLPLAQAPKWTSHVVVKTSSDPLGFVGAIRDAVHSFDPNQPIDDIQTFEQRLATSIAKERFSAVLFGVFSAIAVTLAAVGLYGVLSYGVTQRIQELGIRMALGARRADVLKMIAGHGMKMAFIGVILGLAGALAQKRLIESLLFGVTASDPWTFAVVAISITLIAFVASVIPARRAARTDPIIALKHH